MKYAFSPSMNQFYSTEQKQLYIKAGSWPDDASDVSDDIFNEYSSKPPSGKVRGVKEGAPVWIDAPLPTPEELATTAASKKAALKASADTEIAWRQDAVDADMATDEETAELAEWKKYRVLLMRVDISKAPDINWPEIPA